MEQKNRNQHNGTGSGFIMGVIVGVILTLLFTTKRGREILKEVLEKGVEKFSNLEELMRESYDADEDFADEDDFIPTEPIKESETPKVKQETEGKTEQNVKSQPVNEIPSPTKTVKEDISETKPETDDSTSSSQGKKEKQEEKHEEKPKAVRGKRWFRGLRKKIS